MAPTYPRSTDLDPSRLRWRLRVRHDPPGAVRRRGGRSAPVGPAAHRRVAGADRDHHQAYIAWDTYLANQARIDANTRPRAHEPGTGACAKGCALLQGLAVCGRCGRKLAVQYEAGTTRRPAITATAGNLVNGRGVACGGRHADPTRPSPRPSWPPWTRPAVEAAWPLPNPSPPTATPPWPSGATKSSGPATRRQAERRYMAVDPETGSWPEDSRPTGKLSSHEWPPPKPSWPGERPGPRPSAKTNELQCSLSAPTWTGVAGAHHHRPGPQRAAQNPARRGERRPSAAKRTRPTKWCCVGKGAP